MASVIATGSGVLDAHLVWDQGRMAQAGSIPVYPTFELTI